MYTNLIRPCGMDQHSISMCASSHCQYSSMIAKSRFFKWGKIVWIERKRLFELHVLSFLLFSFYSIKFHLNNYYFHLILMIIIFLNYFSGLFRFYHSFYKSHIHLFGKLTWLCSYGRVFQFIVITKNMHKNKNIFSLFF